MNKDKGKLPPFVPLLKETLDAPAWKAMSHGARALYVALKRRYNREFHNNGKIYLAQRKAAEEIGSHTNQVSRWFRELQHYGFAVMMAGGCLGVDGKGQAPRWRLTELGYMKDPPTRDFMRWKPGNYFKDEKRNPVIENTDSVSAKTRTGVSVKTSTRNGTGVLENTDKGTARGVLESKDKSSIPLVGRSMARPKVIWSAPIIVELEWNDDWQAQSVQEIDDPERAAA
jgi:hypothetical protein